MPTIPSPEAEWLGSPATTAMAVSAAAAAWANDAATRDTISAFANKADADAEAARQIAFLDGPRVTDILSVAGQRHDLIGQPVTLRCAGMGYDAGVTVFVLSAEEADGRTNLTVIRRL